MRELKNKEKKSVYWFSKNNNIFNALSAYLEKNNINIYRVSSLKKINKLDISVIITDSDIEQTKLLLKYYKNDNLIKPYILITNNLNIKSNKYKDFVFIKKPVKITYLLNKIQNNFKNLSLSINNWKINKNSFSLISPNNKFITLTEKELYLIERIIKGLERPVSKITLLEEVWGYNKKISKNICTRVIETHISRIRKKLKKIGLSNSLKKSKDGYFLAK